MNPHIRILCQGIHLLEAFLGRQVLTLFSPEDFSSGIPDQFSHIAGLPGNIPDTFERKVYKHFRLRDFPAILLCFLPLAHFCRKDGVCHLPFPEQASEQLDILKFTHHRRLKIIVYDNYLLPKGSEFFNIGIVRFGDAVREDCIAIQIQYLLIIGSCFRPYICYKPL